MTEWVDVGVLLRAHGFRGEARLRLDPQTPLHRDQKLRLEPRGPRLSPRQTRLLQPRPGAGYWLTYLEGFDSRESLLPFHGARVLWPVADLPDPGPGEFYLWELVGARACRPTGETLGVIESLTNNGAHPLLAIRAPGDPAHRQRLVPAIGPFLRRFDRVARQLELELPEGLWDDA